MCGFVFNFDGQITPELGLSRVQTALNEIAHRGPDELTADSADGAYFAHARLSILDLASSKQPMKSPDGRYTLVFNGELYNFKELRRRLEDRWCFRTTGDTEVLLAGLIIKGTNILAELEGMWAFAFWDSADRSLLLGRDRMGKKPIYYSTSGEAFGCASELSALSRIDSTSWQEDMDSVADYFRFGHCLPGYTMFEGIREVKPAHYLRWRPGQKAVEKPFWQVGSLLCESAQYSDLDLREALNEAVRKRLVADVEVGGFLSGGIDSSLICSIAQSFLHGQLRTYTIGFSDSSFDESRFAAKMADNIGSEHHCETFSVWDRELLEKLTRCHVGQPFADPSLLPTAMVSRLAAHDVKVVLSGDGADEVFGGYQRYQAQVILQWYSRLPTALRKLAEFAVTRLPSPMVHHSRSLLKKAQLFVEAAEHHRSDPKYTARRLMSQHQHRELVPELAGRGHLVPDLEPVTGLDDLERMMFADAVVHLPQDILTKVDRASMAYSLEVRSPFLDSKVIEIAFSRSAHNHLGVGSGKKWLRSAYSDCLPEWVWRRRKQGFGVPLGRWFEGKLGDELLERLNTQASPLNTEQVANLLRQHRAGYSDNSMGLWGIYSYLAMKAG